MNLKLFFPLLLAATALANDPSSPSPAKSDKITGNEDAATLEELAHMKELENRNDHVRFIELLDTEFDLRRKVNEEAYRSAIQGIQKFLRLTRNYDSRWLDRFLRPFEENPHTLNKLIQHAREILTNERGRPFGYIPSYYDDDWRMDDLVAWILSGVVWFPLGRLARIQYNLERSYEPDVDVYQFVVKREWAMFESTFLIREMLHQARQMIKQEKPKQRLPFATPEDDIAHMYKSLLPMLKTIPLKLTEQIPFEITEQKFREVMKQARDTINLEYAVFQRKYLALDRLVKSDANFVESVFTDMVRLSAEESDVAALEILLNSQRMTKLELRWVLDRAVEREDRELDNTNDGRTFISMVPLLLAHHPDKHDLEVTYATFLSKLAAAQEGSLYPSKNPQRGFTRWHAWGPT